jgi:tetratricopeptide (TPR) repeat protein
MDEAIGNFQKAVDLSPQLWGAQNDLAVALWEQGRLAEAIPHMERSLEISPVSGQIYETFVAAPADAQGKDEKLEAENKQRLDAVMGAILALSSAPLRLEDVPMGGPTTPGVQPAPQGLSKPGDVFPRIGDGSRESLEIESRIEGLEISHLWKVVVQNKDAEKVAAARRQILRIFLHSFETGTLRMTQRKYAQAAMCFGLAAEAAQQNPYVLYNQARALALGKQDDEALKTLANAAEKGFADAGRVADDQAFDGLRDRPAFQKAITRMRIPKS